jgi:cytosine/uracil/thiamine/allantoin permease
MKTKTILKTIGFFIGWLVSFQFITVGTHLMNQPSDVAFPLGFLLTLASFLSLILCAGKFGSTAIDLIFEYSESREVKQEEPEQELEEEVKQDKQE